MFITIDDIQVTLLHRLVRIHPEAAPEDLSFRIDQDTLIEQSLQ